ncbi:sphingomyelin phosphodiesterase [Acrasis kona]|uniref:Sphingomyelin phosphodiesterase n=1 Tax=Acrasis kona TaxID=1008807 RepID=A0AAW2Z2F3_9EUKA
MRLVSSILILILVGFVFCLRSIDKDALRAIAGDDPSKVAYFWHITDPHVDLEYKVGSRAICEDVVCCRSSDGNYTADQTAGKYGFIKDGESNCDIPLATFKTGLDFIKSYPVKPEFVFYGGDTPCHVDWDYSEEYNLKYMNTIHDSMRDILGKEMIVLSAIGNHDAAPVDQFDAGPKYSWYTEPFAAQMSFWLPLDVAESITIAGHYNYLVRPGFRALVLNTQYADVLNFYNYKNSSESDPGALIRTTSLWLKQAEAANERVVILAHIPPQATDPWNFALIALCKRYSKTIIGQLYGHTHHDQFHVARDSEGAYSVAYTSPSMTTWSNQHPSVRLFKMDKTTFELLDHVTFYGNVTEANIKGNMTYRMEYSAKEAYGLSDMSPQSWERVGLDFLNNGTAINNYIKYANAFGDADSPKTCGGKVTKECIKELYCDVLNFSKEGFDKCKRDKQ